MITFTVIPNIVRKKPHSSSPYDLVINEEGLMLRQEDFGNIMGEIDRNSFDMSGSLYREYANQVSKELGNTIDLNTANQVKGYAFIPKGNIARMTVKPSPFGKGFRLSILLSDNKVWKLGTKGGIVSVDSKQITDFLSKAYGVDHVVYKSKSSLGIKAH